jgi:selenide,water dikinase
MGVSEIIGALVILGIPPELPINTAKEILRGFQDFCRENDTTIIGGHTILNPWPLIGGAITGVGNPEDILAKAGAEKGDILILTKPLGNQTAMALSRVTEDFNDLIGMTFEEKNNVIKNAIKLMTTSNRNALLVLRELEEEIGEKIANSMTDITGFGILGHANEMAEQSNVEIEISTLPVIKGTKDLASLFGHALCKGYGAETSGGLLISVKEEYSKKLIEKLTKNGIYAFNVGKVLKNGVGIAKLSENVEILEI